MSAKLVCAAAAVLVAVGQVAQWPQQRRVALWTEAGRVLGLEPPPPSSVVRVSAVPAPIATVAFRGVETIEPDRYGQFQANAELDGQRFPVMVDTGASWLSLSYEDADRLGFRPLPSDFRYPVDTANGTLAYARVDLHELRLGSIVVRDVAALVAPRGALWRSLLGMNFLQRLSSFRVDGGRLVLQQ